MGKKRDIYVDYEGLIVAFMSLSVGDSGNPGTGSFCSVLTVRWFGGFEHRNDTPEFL